jgi:hypothetical protein
VELSYAQEVLTRTNGQVEYKHTNGEISIVRVDMAGMGTKRVRIANLPPETKEEKIRAAPSQYGDIRDIQKGIPLRSGQWHSDCDDNTKKKHIPSRLAIVGHRALAAYEGQPEKCYGCGETGHVYIVCPHRRTVERPSNHEPTSWTTIATKPPQTQRSADKEKNKDPNDQRYLDGPIEEELTKKEINDHVASTHCSEATIEQHYNTGHASINRQSIINTTPESTELVKQNVSDRMELSDEDVNGTTISTANKDDIQQIEDGKHDRTMRLENQMSWRDEEEAYTVILEKTHVRTTSRATCNNR